VNGLQARLPVALDLWRRAGFQVVFLQETHLTLFTATRVERQLAAAGWRAFWAFSPCSSAGRGRAGTAVLIRTRLVTSGALRLVGGADQAVARGPGGRYVAVRARWCGHDLHLCSVYLPNCSTERRAYIREVLGPLAAAAAGRSLLWGGDFNFVPDARRDRVRCGPAGGPNPPSHPDDGTQRAWAAALPSLADVFRVRHPGHRAYTYLRSDCASRLDRFYTTAAVLPYVGPCRVLDWQCSDHRPVSLTLVGLEPAALGPGPRRVRLGFLSTPALADDLRAWLEQQLLAAPEDAFALLLWWPQFKHCLAARCVRLQRASRALAGAAQVAAAELRELHAGIEAGDASLLGAAIAARTRFAEAANAALADERLRRRRSWVHVGERPGPALTRRLRARQQDRVVPALRSAAGGLLHAGPACAQRAAQYWASVSAAPPTDPGAQQEVLAAMSAGRRLPPEQAAALAERVVQPAEVQRALRCAPSGRAPGLDGLPVELYRRHKEFFVPLLARLFTAVATLRVLPAGFHEGLITTLYKAGERSDPANYRPITLLNSDYRLFAKVLARRLGPCLASVIDPEQTAFVPGRCIGENVMLLQCLPHLLRRRGASALVAFCDFRKAYDTVDRSFLWRALLALGLGEGFVALARLTGTRARAVVNGYVSTPAAFEAGVRQGCPLAPLLYLFVAQGLLRLLKARGLGLPVGPRRLAAMQYADDAEALLAGPAQVPAFLAAVHAFGDATGQRLNAGKTVLLHVGAPPPAPLPAQLHGLRVVATATALGLEFGAADSTAKWPQLLEGVRGCFTRLAGLPLSVFGRGFASAAYGVSKVLYHAEFTGVPPAAAVTELCRVTAKVVERQLPPASTLRKFAGVPGWALVGRPAEGGFGALHWVNNVLARHAKWALALLLGGADVPWVFVAGELLRCCAGEVAAHHLMGLLTWAKGEPPPGAVAPLPPPLRRLHEGLASLPAVEDVGEVPLVPGDWCWAAPLWGNPFLRSPLYPDGLDHPFFDFAAAGLATVGHVVRLRRALAAAPGAAAYAPVWEAHLRRYPAFADRARAQDRLSELADALPHAWLAAAEGVADGVAAGLLPEPRLREALGVLLPRLGWRVAGRPVPLRAYTVRAGSALLLAPVGELRRLRYLSPYASQAVGVPSGGPVEELLDLLPRLWRVRWENKYKEPFWRLVHDALPTAARLHSTGLPCPCGTGGQRPDRLHHFWACPVAQAVVGAIGAAVAAAGRPQPEQLSRAHIWLARPPAGVRPSVWRVVCLAAVAAMDSGRRHLARWLLAPAQQPAGTPLHEAAARAAVARFWCLLADFAALRAYPRSFPASLPAGHPFLAPGALPGALVVHRPPA
jgi:exonuclease III